MAANRLMPPRKHTYKFVGKRTTSAGMTAGTLKSAISGSINSNRTAAWNNERE